MIYKLVVHRLSVFNFAPQSSGGSRSWCDQQRFACACLSLTCSGRGACRVASTFLCSMMPLTPYEQIGTKAVFPLVYFLELGVTLAVVVSRSRPLVVLRRCLMRLGSCLLCFRCSAASRPSNVRALPCRFLVSSLACASQWSCAGAGPAFSYTPWIRAAVVLTLSSCETSRRLLVSVSSSLRPCLLDRHANHVERAQLSAGGNGADPNRADAPSPTIPYCALCSPHGGHSSLVCSALRQSVRRCR